MDDGHPLRPRFSEANCLHMPPEQAEEIGMEQRERKERRPRKPAPEPEKAGPPVDQSRPHKKEAKPPPRFSPKRQAAFLAALEACGTIRGAARAAQVARQCHYTWLKEDPTYEERYRGADQVATDSLIEEATRRAVKGVGDVVLFGGQPVKVSGKTLVRRRFSDNLLMFLIKAKRPEYRDRVGLDLHSIPGQGGDPDEGERKLNEPPPPDD